MTRHVGPAVRFLLVLCASGLLGGCVRAFGDAGSHYDEQACIENALRRHPSVELTVAAARKFSAACRDDEAASCSALGVMYELGEGVPRDAARALVLYEKACADDNERSCVNLGAALSRGVGTTQDEHRAGLLLSKACDAGEMLGCAILGQALLERIPRGPTDFARGRSLLERACAARERAACADLGDLLSDLHRHDEALRAYAQACLAGDDAACRRMNPPLTRSSQEAAAGWRTR